MHNQVGYHFNFHFSDPLINHFNYPSGVNTVTNASNPTGTEGPTNEVTLTKQLAMVIIFLIPVKSVGRDFAL